MPLVETALLPALLEAARRAHNTGEGRAILQAAGFRALAGGANNAVYALRCGDRSYCLKFFRVDGRRRDRREWRALQLLRSRGCAFSPRPVAYRPDAQPPLVVMEFVEGRGLGERHLTRAQLAALAAVIEEGYAITPGSGCDRLWPVVSDAPRRVRWLRYAAREGSLPTGDAPTREAHALLWAWLDGPDPATLLEAAPVAFSRGDPNLANCLWDSERQRLRLVDFEYSGWSDRAFDLADLVEHVQSRRTPEDEWGWFVERFDLSGRERRRFAAARRLLALFWVIKFWPGGAGTPGERFAAQLERARALGAGLLVFSVCSVVSVVSPW